MDPTTLTLLALCVLGFGAISGRSAGGILTPPMAFAGLGLLLGPLGMGILDLGLNDGFIEILAELTLILVLFTDASRIELSRLRHEHDIPVRLLALGMPLTLVLGTLTAAFLFDYLSFYEAALLAAILTPTDAALGQAVVSNPKVPVRIRQALNVESGLNDGIALPLVLIFISCSSAAGHVEGAGYWVRFILLQVTLGPLIGGAIGFLGGKLVEWGERSGWMSHTFQDLSALALALLSYGGAELVGGNGFIAAFAAGLVLGNSSRRICTCLYEFAESEGQLLSLLVFLILGAVVFPVSVEFLDWGVLLYALLSLTLIRALPVMLSLLGKKLHLSTLAFLGWFGPRGIASILFAIVALEDLEGPAIERVSAIVAATVMLSIFAHGLSASPGANWYAGVIRTDQGAARPEHGSVGEMPTRLKA